MRKLRVLPLGIVLAGFAFFDRPVSVYLAGDSTIAQKLHSRRPETGWGERLQEHFDLDRVRVRNDARNGRSTRTFLSEGRWQAIVDDLRRGDYVFIQFGHNDASVEKVDRYTPPADYRRNLARFVAEVRAKEAHPVLMTPVMRRRFDEQGEFYDAHGEYPDLVRAAAVELRVPLIDMHRRSERVIRDYGAERSKRLFLHLAAGESANYPQGLRDDTHFSPLGAEIMAGLVVDGIRESVPGLAALLHVPAPRASHQDTLFPNAGRTYFHRCEVSGSVDFIFGAGRAVFDDCDVVSRDRRSAANNGYVTAPSTPISQPHGFLFVRSRLKKETPSVAPSSVTLGRPWHPSGRPDVIGSAVFVDTWMDDHVGATGWSPMNSRDAAGHTGENRPEDARFFEFGTTGPGAVHTIVRVLDGWDPTT